LTNQLLIPKRHTNIRPCVNRELPANSFVGWKRNRGLCLKRRASKMNRIIYFLDGDKFKFGCYIFLAFAAGYFLRSIL
jgi:hypothetical protein